jgi:hypothetical protein
MQARTITHSDGSEKQGIKWIERLSYLLDEQFLLPGTKFRFGLDPLLSLIPFLGSTSGFFISGALLLYMVKNGVSGKVLVLMIINIVLDASIGAIPVIGNVFDFYFKANSRNIRLLKEHYLENKHHGSGKGILITAIIVLIIFAVLIIYGIWELAELIFSADMW